MSNGLLEESFNANPTNNNVVDIVRRTSDGKILVGGVLTIIDGQPQTNLALLDINGTIDNSFNPILDGTVITIEIQPDNKILIGGNFTSINMIPRDHIVRLNSDGSLDISFDAMNVDNSVFTILEMGTNILVGGSFTMIGGLDSRALALLDAHSRIPITLLHEFSFRIQRKDNLQSYDGN